MGGHKETDLVEKVFDVLIAICGVFLLLGGNVMVFGRVLSLSVPWAEELMRNVFIWMLFFGAAFESKRKLVAVTICDDIAVKKRSAGFYKFLMLTQTAAILIFAGLSAVWTYVQAADQFKMKVTSLNLKYPTGIFTLLVAIAFTLMFVYQCKILVRRIRTPKDEMLAAVVQRMEED